MTFQGNIDTLSGRTVYGSDGHRIGTVGQIFVMQGTEQPTWVTVQTGLFGTHESFVPMAEATERGDELVVPYEKAFVKDAPRIDEASELSVEQEGELYRYYGVQPPVRQADASGHHGAAGHAGDGHGDAPLHTGHRDEGQRDDGRRDDDARHSGDDRDTHHRLDADTAGAAAAGGAAAAAADSGDGSIGGPRLRRRIVTEMQTVQVPVQREEIYVEGDELPGRADDDRRG